MRPTALALAGPHRGFFKAIKTGWIDRDLCRHRRPGFTALNAMNQTWSRTSQRAARGAADTRRCRRPTTGSSSSISISWDRGAGERRAAGVRSDVIDGVCGPVGVPPQARYIAVVGDFVVLSGLLNNPYRVQWSALGDPTGWTPALNSSDFQDLPDGGVVRGVAGGENGNIFQDTAIRRMIYAPGSPVIFQIERISDDRGLYAPYSLIRSGGQIFSLGPQGFQQYGTRRGYPQPIGKEKVDRTFFQQTSTRAISNSCIGASDPRNRSRVLGLQI